MDPLCFLKACIIGLWLQRFPSQSRYHTQYGQCILDRPVCTTEIVERNLSAHEHVSEVWTAVVCGHQYKPIDYKNNVQTNFYNHSWGHGIINLGNCQFWSELRSRPAIHDGYRMLHWPEIIISIILKLPCHIETRTTFEYLGIPHQMGIRSRGDRRHYSLCLDQISLTQTVMKNHFYFDWISVQVVELQNQFRCI